MKPKLIYKACHGYERLILSSITWIVSAKGRDPRDEMVIKLLPVYTFIQWSLKSLTLDAKFGDFALQLNHL